MNELSTGCLLYFKSCQIKVLGIVIQKFMEIFYIKNESLTTLVLDILSCQPIVVEPKNEKGLNGIKRQRERIIA